VGAFGGKREIMEHIAPAGPVYQAGTLSGNPLAMTAGYETLNALTKEDYKVIEKKIDRLEEGFRQASKKHEIPIQINRVGSMFGIFFSEEPVVNFETAQKSNLDYFSQYYRAMIEEGIYLPPSQFEGLFLSTAHTDEDIEKTVQAIDKAFSKIEK